MSDLFVFSIVLRLIVGVDNLFVNRIIRDRHETFIVDLSYAHPRLSLFDSFPHHLKTFYTTLSKL